MGDRPQCQTEHGSSKANNDRRRSIKGEAYFQHANCKKLDAMGVDAIAVLHLLLHDSLQ